MGCVDADVHENVEGFDGGDVYWYQAAVRVVHQKIAAEGARGVVVDTAGAVRDIAHDEGFNAIAEFGEDI